MANKEPKDVLASVIRREIAPVMARHGFILKTNKEFGRIRDGIYQSMYFYKTAWGGGDFRVHYNAMQTYTNWEHPHAGYGSTLKRPSRWKSLPSGGEWWMPSRILAEVTAHLPDLLLAIETQAIPFYHSTDSTAKMNLFIQSRLADHHRYFDLGRGLARLGETYKADAALVRCLELYKEDGRDWCHDFAREANRLLSALRAGRATEVLDQWQLEFIARNRLQKLM